MNTTKTFDHRFSFASPASSGLDRSDWYKAENLELGLIRITVDPTKNYWFSFLNSFLFPSCSWVRKKVMAWFFYALFGLDMQIAFNPSYVFTEITNVLEQRNVRKKSIDLNREPFCFFYKTVMIWELAWKCNFESTFLPTWAKKIKAMNSFIFLRLNFLQSLILEYQG